MPLPGSKLLYRLTKSKRLKCLIIDDDVNIQNILKTKLSSSERYEVFQATDGDIGLEIMQEILPDFILLDWMMPKMSGLEVLSKIREDKDFSSMPVFMLTGRGKMHDMETALAAGATGYFTKPIKLKHFLYRLRLALDAI